MERVEDFEKVILDYIAKNGSINEAEYKGLTDRARSTRILDFKRLVAKGLIIRQRKGRATFYIASGSLSTGRP